MITSGVYPLGILVLWLIFLSPTFGDIHNTGDDQVSTCTYTFHVPLSDGNACPPGSQSHDGDEALLQALLSNTELRLRDEIKALALKLDQVLEGQLDLSFESNYSKNALGTTYVRWGRTVCPDTATLLYDGYTGKAYFEHGGGVNYLCLPKDPEYPDGAAGSHESQSNIYGTEYHGNSPVLDNSLHNDDVPCVVCDVTGRSRTLMIPAKRSCPTDWTKEYEGLLMAQHKTHKGSEYICVSNGMEALVGGSRNTDGGLLYVVEAMCGALPCPPYTDGKEIACVVCSK